MVSRSPTSTQRTVRADMHVLFATPRKDWSKYTRSLLAYSAAIWSSHLTLDPVARSSLRVSAGEPVSVSVDSGDSTLRLSQLSPGSSYEVSVISVLGLDESDPIRDFVVTRK